MVDIFNLATLAGGSSSTQHIIKAAYYICIRGLHGVYISSQKQALCSRLHQPVFHQAAAYLFQRRVCITSIHPVRPPAMDVFHIEKRSETIATRCRRNSHSICFTRRLGNIQWLESHSCVWWRLLSVMMMCTLPGSIKWSPHPLLPALLLY